MNTFSTASGATSINTCVNCPNGTYASNERSACLSCQEGSVFNTSLSACIACGVGKFASNGDANEDCPIGTFSDIAGISSIDKCLPCPKGTFSKAPKQTRCITCPIGYYSNTTGNPSESFCLPCLLGQYGNNGVCYSCAAGHYSDKFNIGSALECTPCSIGYFSSLPGQNSSSACQKCPRGFFTNSSATVNCQPCSKGYYNDIDGSSSCFPCADANACLVAAISSSIQVPKSSANASSVTETGNSTVNLSSESIAQIAIIISAICLLLLLIVFSVVYFLLSLKFNSIATPIKKALLAIDAFSLKHFVKPEKPVINHSTWFGGFVTAILMVLVVMIVIVSILDVVKDGNITQSISLVPLKQVNSSIIGNYKVEILLYTG